MRRVTNLPNEWYEDVSPGVRRLHPPGIGFKWTDIVLKQVDSQDATALLMEMGFSPEIIQAAIDPHGESVRYRHLGSSLLRLEIPSGVLIDSDQDYLLSILQGKDQLVTIRRRPMGIVEDACSGIADQDPESVTMLAVTAELGDEFLDRLVPSLRRIAEELDDIESELEERRADRVDRVAHVRRLLLRIDRHIDPLQSAIQRSLLDMTSRNNGPVMDALRGLHDRANWFEHRIQGQLDRVRVLTDREHILAMDDLSTSMYRLSWIATIFLPLTFVTGLLGINVGGIPFAKAASGFWFVCGVLVLIAAGTTLTLILVLRYGKHGTKKRSKLKSSHQENRS
ncbi:MAG: hypothetical protein CMJ67_04275 [Planctomycetaceae bacterium]|nr:hypothetical protein [Planctomycetaceae bacterium]